MTVFRCAHAWVGGVALPEVDIRVDGGRITSVGPSAEAGVEVVELPGLVLPGFANAHSHAFHRALRGRTHGDGGTFWTWREAMYRLAAALDPDSYHALARAVFAEMALSGVTSVGEFHYVHHQPDGRPYDDPNAMGEALRAAAREAGVRLTLLDTCYLAGGLDASGPLPLRPEQARFGDGTAQGWVERVAQLGDDDRTRIGAAIHSVRAVPRDAMAVVAEAAAGRPLHAHLSEQPAENEACEAAYRLTPTQVMAEAGALGPLSSMVHATHLTAADIALLGSTSTCACFCPTTERDLADGIGPARALLEAGAVITLGSDQHAVIDLLEEARAVEMHERLVTHQRGNVESGALMAALTSAGQRSLGWDDAGSLAVGQRADLVCVRLDTVRTAGSLPDQALMAATAADVDTVVVDGRVVVSGGRHRSVDVAAELSASIRRLWDAAEAAG